MPCKHVRAVLARLQSQRVTLSRWGELCLQLSVLIVEQIRETGLGTLEEEDDYFERPLPPKPQLEAGRTERVDTLGVRAHDEFSLFHPDEYMRFRFTTSRNGRQS